MLRGLQFPVMPDPNGRAMMVEEETDQLAKIIAIGLCDCSSENPFQSLGIPMDNVFDLGDSVTRGKLKDYLESFFRRLQNQGRARLLDVFAHDQKTDNGETVLEIKYVDIKSRTPRSTLFGIGRTGTARVLEG